MFSGLSGRRRRLGRRSAAHGWARQLGAEATVQVRPRVGESGDTAAARAAETLAGVNGVEEAAALDRKAAEDLLRPGWATPSCPTCPCRIW
ncbi:hypothetical protein [Brevundimonas aurantiaca]|uniref:hypothetical protein n=1 Tax=Brevundimonas aurantiaca TaxID=74316 RepID=UPI0027961A40|nr:hypothetical protein [Brevundimonas aurantiaca]